MAGEEAAACTAKSLLLCCGCRGQQRLVEEAGHALLVGAWLRLDAAGVAGAVDAPDLLRLGGGAVVPLVELLAAGSARRVDQQERPRCDPLDEVSEGRRRRRAAERGERGGLHGRRRKR